MAADEYAEIRARVREMIRQRDAQTTKMFTMPLPGGDVYHWSADIRAAVDKFRAAWDAASPQTTHIRISPLPHMDDFVRHSLSASWHHLPCVTAGVPDPREVHPVVAANRRSV